MIMNTRLHTPTAVAYDHEYTPHTPKAVAYHEQYHTL